MPLFEELRYQYKNELKKLVKKWFGKWEEGDFLDLPISENFKHTSPYGKNNMSIWLKPTKTNF